MVDNKSIIFEANKIKNQKVVPFQIMSIVIPLAIMFFATMIKSSASEGTYTKILYGAFITLVVLMLVAVIQIAKQNGLKKEYIKYTLLYLEAWEKAEVPNNAIQIIWYGSNILGYQLWAKNNSLNMFVQKTFTWEVPQNYQIPKTEVIPFSQVKVFYTEGDRFYENKISGGGSDGPNIAGAIIGDAIAGSTGAIIGGQQKINPIESELVLHDERRTIVEVEVDGQEQKQYFSFNLYELLEKVMPSKNKAIIDEISKHKILVEAGVKGEIYESKKKDSSSISEKLKVLQELHSSGLINDKDYEEKKKQILSDM